MMWDVPSVLLGMLIASTLFTLTVMVLLWWKRRRPAPKRTDLVILIMEDTVEPHIYPRTDGFERNAKWN